jgi:hypothetical protein
MKRWLLATGNWFDARLKVRETLLPMMRHPIPREGSAGSCGRCTTTPGRAWSCWCWRT